MPKRRKTGGNGTIQGYQEEKKKNKRLKLNKKRTKRKTGDVLRKRGRVFRVDKVGAASGGIMCMACLIGTLCMYQN
jgi:hypothetical protein